MIKILGKKTDDQKAIRKEKVKEIEAAYVARKKSMPEEVPKYLKISYIDMSKDTFKKVFMCPKVISEDKMKEFINNGQLHN